MAERVAAMGWRLGRQYYSLEGEECVGCHMKIFPPRDICPECFSLNQKPNRVSLPPRNPTFGKVKDASEIGTRNGKKEFVIEVDLASGFEAKLLYEGDIQEKQRVRINYGKTEKEMPKASIISSPTGASTSSRSLDCT
jgi:uncharacterized OB-fold protein